MFLLLLLRSKRGSHWQITFCIMARCTIVRMAYYHLVLGGSLVGKRGVLQRFVHSGMGWGLPLQPCLANQSKITKKCRLWRQPALGSKSNVGLSIKKNWRVAKSNASFIIVHRSRSVLLPVTASCQGKSPAGLGSMVRKKPERHKLCLQSRLTRVNPVYLHFVGVWTVLYSICSTFQ